MFDRLQRSAPAQGNVAGLLFGRIDQEICEVQVFRSFPDAEGIFNLAASQDQLTAMMDRLIAGSRQDPEVSTLNLLGWYSFRASGGLHESDVDFHNRFFRHPNEVALILRPEQHPNVLFEIYSKSGTTVLSEDEHRWGSLRLSSGSTVLGPIDVSMRAKIGDDFYLRAYQVSKTLDRAERREHWANAVAATKSTVRSIFRQKRQETFARDATANLPSASEPVTPPPQFARAAAAAAIDPPPPIFSRSIAQQGFSAATELAEPVFSRRARDYAPAPARDAASAQRIVAGDPPALPAVIKAPKRGVPWLSSVIVFAIAAGATFALYVQGYANSGETPHFLRAIFPDTGLGLKVEGEGDRVLLSWNRRNALVRSSRGGVLHIDDGPQHRAVRLDAAQIANGSVLYRPGSDDVSFRLEVHGAQGAAIAETTRVLDGAKVQPLDAKNLSPDVSGTEPAAGPPTATTLSAPRDSHPRRDDKATEALPTRSTHSPAPPPASITNPVGAPEYHPTPVRETAVGPSPVTTSPVTTTPPHTDSTTPPPTTNSLTTAKPAQVNTPAAVLPTEQQHTASLPSQTPTQTPTETSRPSVPIISQETITRPPDSSRLSGWEDLPAKPAEPTPTRTSAPPPSTTSPAQSAFVPPKPLKQVLPDLRSIAPSSVSGTPQLEIAVRVNKKGRVTEAYLVGDASKVPPHLARAALNAAKQWTFQPATIRGKSVPSDHTIVFEFRPTGH